MLISQKDITKLLDAGFTLLEPGFNEENKFNVTQYDKDHPGGFELQTFSLLSAQQAYIRKQNNDPNLIIVQ